MNRGTLESGNVRGASSSVGMDREYEDMKVVLIEELNNL